MRFPDFFSGIFWLCFGLLLSFWSTCYQIGSVVQPGAGFLPLILGILMILLSILLLVKAKGASRATKMPASSSLPGGWKKVAYTVSIMLLATFLFEFLGYLLTFFLLLILLMRGTGPQKWRKTLLVSSFSAFIIYLIFVLLLKQPLPKGLLGI
jgi:putative tricarboxylic transport membrane protein